MAELLDHGVEEQPSEPAWSDIESRRRATLTRVRAPRHYRLLALVIGVIALTTAALLPYRLLNPPPDLVTAGGSLGRSIQVHSRAGLATVGVSSAEWVTTSRYQKLLILGLEATGEWGSLAAGGNQFAIVDDAGKRVGSITPPRGVEATPWRWGWIRAGERWRGSLVFEAAKSDLSLEIYDDNAELAATFRIPRNGKTRVEGPHSVQIPLGTGTSVVPIQAGDSTGELRVIRTQVLRAGAPELQVRLSLAVQRGSLEPDSTWFVQSPAPSADDDGINELHISLSYGAAARGKVSGGHTVLVRLVLRDFATGSMVTIVYEDSDIARILLAEPV